MASTPFLSKTPINNFSSSLSPSLHPLPSTLSQRKTNPNSLRVNAKIREIFMPALSSTMTEGKIVSWIKSEGDLLSKGESVVVVESDKADMDVKTFYDGILAAIVVPEGETAPVGVPIGLLAETEEEIAEAKAKAASKASGSTPPLAENVTPTPPPPPTSTPAPAISHPPAAPEGPRKTTVTPVTPADVEAAAGIAVSKPSKSLAATVKAAASSSVPPPLPGSNIVPFTTMQAAVSKNMVESLSVPTFRVGYLVITDALDAFHDTVKPKGVSVTMTALLAKAAAMALVQHLQADADKLDLYLLSKKWKELVVKARAKQLQPHEYNSGTFTVSNLGMFGVYRFDAILPPGHGAIMAVGASKPTVLADKDGFFSVKNKMLVNVTADNRIVYGADLAAFLQTFARIVENPESLKL
uniref:Dihydrolipoamide acetyltransferase component of pyruvate dehydrogenase complex n=1 Tax=Populus alba TaxID=43335 RepID=A0A4U5NQI0_POPAL|nr:hypothetical protein D5086_0000252940 [Populus alba]